MLKIKMNFTKPDNTVWCPLSRINYKNYLFETYVVSKEILSLIRIFSYDLNEYEYIVIWKSEASYISFNNDPIVNSILADADDHSNKNGITKSQTFMGNITEYDSDYLSYNNLFKNIYQDGTDVPAELFNKIYFDI